MKIEYFVKRLEALKEILEPLQSAMEDDGLSSYAGELEDGITTINALIFVANNHVQEG